MANAVAVVGARLNSSRLPGKQLLDLAGRPMISRIFDRLEQVAALDEVILATTSDAFNQPLVDWANEAGKKVYAHSGDVDDLVGRVVSVLAGNTADIIVYVCGDSPLIEPESIDRLVHALQENPDAMHAYLTAPGSSPLIHEGFAVYRRSLWNMLDEVSVSREEREHVGLAINKLGARLSSVVVDEDELYSRVQHRLSVDTLSDYIFMQEVYSRWYRENDPEDIVSLPWLIDALQQDSVLRDINVSVRQKQVDEPGLKVIIGGAVSEIGDLGAELWQWLARFFQDRFAASVEVWLPPGLKRERYGHLNLFPGSDTETMDAYLDRLSQVQARADVNVLVLTVTAPWVASHEQLLQTLKARGLYLIGLSETDFSYSLLDLLIDVSGTREEAELLLEERIQPELRKWLSETVR